MMIYDNYIILLLKAKFWIRTSWCCVVGDACVRQQKYPENWKSSYGYCTRLEYYHYHLDYPIIHNWLFSKAKRTCVKLRATDKMAHDIKEFDGLFNKRKDIFELLYTTEL